MRVLIEQVVPFTLVLGRLVGLVFALPAISGRMVPMRARALLAFLLAAAMYPGVVARAGAGALATDASMLELGGLVAREAIIGLSMGLLASIPLAAAGLGGFIMSHQVGLGIAQSYDPQTDSENEVVANLMSYVAAGAFLALGGPEMLFATLAVSFERIPVGGLAMHAAPLDLLVGVVTSGFELAIRIAAPVMGMVFLVLIALGAVMKTIPQLNAMTIGFTLKIVLGILVLAASLRAIDHAVAGEFEGVLQAIASWVGQAAQEGDA